MPLPLIIVVGSAGSGKDTVASMIAKNYGGVVLAQADIMKRFARDAFGFTEAQLWGPSDNRNAIDTRFLDAGHCSDVGYRLEAWDVGDEWLQEIQDGSFDADDARVSLSHWGYDILDRDTLIKDGGLTPRKCLQTLGTEFGRRLSKEVWTTYARKVAIKLLGGNCTYTAQEGLKESDDNHNFVIVSDGRFRNEIVGVKALGGVALKIISPVADNSAVEKAGVANHRSESEQRSIPDYFFDAIIMNDKANGLAVLKQIVNRTVHNLFPTPNFYGKYL